MRKIIQRAFAVMAALLMALAVVRPALAAGTGQIVVADAGSETYTAFMIFDASDASGNVTYTIAANSPWLDLVYDTETHKSKVTGLEFTGPTDGKYAVEQVIGFDAADFAQYLKGKLPTDTTTIGAIGFTKNATNDTASTNANLDPGYYLVVSRADGGQTYQERAMLTTVLDKDVTIQNKNDMPLDKTYKVNDATDPFKESDAKIGDVLYFEITGEVPNTSQYKSYTYILSDTMDAGLTFNNNSLAIVITDTNGDAITPAITPAVVTDANSQLSGNEVRYNSNGLTFELSLDLLQLGKEHAGAKIAVTYTATVNEDAASKVSENNAVLTYSNNPNNPTSFATKDTETKTYTSRIIVDKFESGAPEQKLAGAVFRLYKIAPTTGSGLEPGKSMNADGTVPEGYSKWYYIATLNDQNQVTNVSWTKDDAQASKKKTQSDGSARFAGIKDGVYYLEEVTAPAGYAKLTEPIEIVVNGSSATTEGLTADQVAYSLTKVASVSNTPDSLLPSTGGMGTTLFYAASAVLLAIIVKRFARNDQSQTA